MSPDDLLLITEMNLINYREIYGIHIFKFDGIEATVNPGAVRLSVKLKSGRYDTIHIIHNHMTEYSFDTKTVTLVKKITHFIKLTNPDVSLDFLPKWCHES